MTILQKLCKKKIITLIIPIIEDEKELYIRTDYFKRDVISIHHVLI